MALVFFEEVDSGHFSFLYGMLGEREATQNISHSVMPSYDQHCRFCMSAPYRYWYVCKDANYDLVGNCYITWKGEIGLFVEKDKHGKGLGSSILKSLILKHHNDFPDGLFANINPANERSKRLFEKFGFGKIQETYKMVWEDTFSSSPS